MTMVVVLQQMRWVLGGSRLGVKAVMAEHRNVVFDFRVIRSPTLGVSCSRVGTLRVKKNCFGLVRMVSVSMNRMAYSVRVLIVFTSVRRKGGHRRLFTLRTNSGRASIVDSMMLCCSCVILLGLVGGGAMFVLGSAVVQFVCAIVFVSVVGAMLGVRAMSIDCAVRPVVVEVMLGRVAKVCLIWLA